MFNEFVAIDFETANEKRGSACAVGLVKFGSDGEPDDAKHSLIRPHETLNRFSPINMWIHGIRPEDVADKPEWGEMYGEVREFIGDLPLVAHNMGFDGSVLNQLGDLYDLEPLENLRLCTVRLSRRILADVIKRKSLDEVYGYYFPGEEFDHHVAEADALAAGRIFARMQADHGYDSLVEWCPPVRRSRAQRGLPALTHHEDFEALQAKYGGTKALAGESVVFTGTLSRGVRSVVQELVRDLGGSTPKSFVKSTTMLVVGIPNPASFSMGASESRKLQKANKMREEGSPITVLSEDEFFDLLLDAREDL